MKFKKIVALLVASLLVFVAVGCKTTKLTTLAPTEEPINDADAVAHVSNQSVYEKVGSRVTIDMVVEDAEGVAWATVDSVKYELGMDFLSMAMVYNCSVPASSTKYQNQEDVYNEWWKLYIQRWNMLVPEVPLYSNIYYDIYNAKLSDFVTTPYYGPADAIIKAKILVGESSIILGSGTDLSGAFRSASWGKSSPGASDSDVQDLTTGFQTVQNKSDGSYVWNMEALASEPVSVVNADGTLTYTINLKEGLKFSDGSAINADNYLVAILCNSSPVGVAAGGTGTSGNTLVGYDAFKAYDGTGDTVYFEGVKKLGDYELSLTYTPDYAGYYYSIINAALSPQPKALFLGSGDLAVDEDSKEVGLNAEFYQKEGTVYKQAQVIKNNLKWDSELPYSGPYKVKNYDATTKTATLELNSLYPGDVKGQATILKIEYIKVEQETQMAKFQAGEVDVIAGITGGAETEAALQVVRDNPTKYKETHYDRAGYGKLGFRADFGSTSFQEVRQAIMYTINRPEFAQTFTGGHGSVVNGPYYTGFSAYQASKDSIKLNAYSYSKDAAIEVLEDGGWVYDVNGNAYVSGVRYKKLSGYGLSVDNLHFKSTDGKYKTVKKNGSYYMPLVVNYYGTQPNTVTDQLLTAWATNKVATEDIGMYIVYTSTTFNDGLYGELFRIEDYGYDGVPKLNAINFASGFTSAAYDYSFNWTIDPAMYEDVSSCYLKDEADFAENYK